MVFWQLLVGNLAFDRCHNHTDQIWCTWQLCPQILSSNEPVHHRLSAKIDWVNTGCHRTNDNSFIYLKEFLRLLEFSKVWIRMIGPVFLRKLRCARKATNGHLSNTVNRLSRSNEKCLCNHIDWANRIFAWKYFHTKLNTHFQYTEFSIDKSINFIPEINPKICPKPAEVIPKIEKNSPERRPFSTKFLKNVSTALVKLIFAFDIHHVSCAFFFNHKQLSSGWPARYEPNWMYSPIGRSVICVWTVNWSLH